MKITITGLLFLCLSVFSFAQVKGDNSFTMQENFFLQYKELAQDQMKVHRIPASIKLAQAALESNWGRSELAQNAKNFFGMKCRNKKECTEKVYEKVDDDKDKMGNTIPSKFLVFGTAEDSFYAHSFFLKDGKRYQGLFDLNVLDYKKWAEGLEKAGYATNPEYAEKLIAMIEKYGLHKIDQQAENGTAVTNVQKNALDEIAESSAPSYPGQAGSSQVERPKTTVNAFPTEKPNPVTSGTASSDENMIDGVEANIHDQNFGSFDVSNYEPAFKKMQQDDSDKGGESSEEKLKKYPPKKMQGGDSKPR